LSELGDINCFIAELLDCPARQDSSWHWPSFYMLYVEVDRLSMLLSRVGYLFDPPLTSFGGVPTPEEYARDANGLFASIDKQQKTIVRSLYQLYRAVRPTAEQVPLHDGVGAHVHPKSGWYQTFMQCYRSGEVTSDAKMLSRTALPIDHGTSREHIDFMTAECMLRRQSFDIGTPEERHALAQATQVAQCRIGHVVKLMGDYLVAHCRIEDLRYPSSR
jgi:hypothetical protein